MILGHSVLGRPIEGKLFGREPVKVLVFGAIHGDEPASAALCERWQQRLSDRDARGGPSVGVLVVPVVNPDGFSAHCKDNAHGVDLNRNFPAQSFSLDHPPRYNPGPHPLSEPESAALAGAIDQWRPPILIAVHQPFRCVNWDGPAFSLAQKMSELCQFPLKESIGYPTPGSFGSYYGHDLKQPVITLELSQDVGEAEFYACMAALDCVIMPDTEPLTAP